uniref:Uncharacterized protein MANES_08G016300 n=1 Tax=Rhizophora mucronata TaxID=61149 RepID=A0A2P2LGJ0_RHIMU
MKGCQTRQSYHSWALVEGVTLEKGSARFEVYQKETVQRRISEKKKKYICTTKQNRSSKCMTC